VKKDTTLVLVLAAAGALAAFLLLKKPKAQASASNQNFQPTSRIPQNFQLGFRAGAPQRGTDWGQVATAGASVLGSLSGLFKKESSTPSSIYSPSVTSAQVDNKATWVDAPDNTPEDLWSGDSASMWS
jgi:hypothetical protein